MDSSPSHVLHTAKTHCPDANVILLTVYPAWESAKEAMQLGAFNHFEKGQRAGTGRPPARDHRHQG
jgi:DNA-binding NtrC family response regulator